VHLRLFNLLALSSTWLLLCCSACQSLPPAITGITIYPTDAHGQPQGDDLCRTAIRPPVPVIGVRPGADPHLGSSFLNEPVTGQVAITLARGVQNFLLFTAWLDPADRVAIAVYLDGEPTPALVAVVDPQHQQPMAPATSGRAIGMDGEPLTSQAVLSAVRGAYRVTLQQAAFPLDAGWIDPLAPWGLQPDNVPDLVGVITLEVTHAS